MYLRLLKIATLCICVSYLFTQISACKKTPITIPQPIHHDSTPQPPNPDTSSHSIPEPDLTVDNTWQVEINGVLYSGTIDSSYITLYPHPENHYDTTVTFIGTSTDKKANITFYCNINRPHYTSPTTSQLEAGIFFDTCSFPPLYFYSPYSDIIVSADSVTSKKAKGHFEGTGEGGMTVKSGYFSCEFGNGTNEPKFYSISTSGTSTKGTIGHAEVIANSLFIDGQPLDSYGDQYYHLQIYTGGTIHPGVYKSRAAEAALRTRAPGFIIDDSSIAEFTVNVNNVDGSIVSGTFNNATMSGDFRCRVKNYVPELDDLYRWKLTIGDNHDNYQILGGNLHQAQFSQVTNQYNVVRYQLRIIGESDHGNSTFQTTLSSSTPIVPGIYTATTDFHFDQRIDSMSFRSSKEIWKTETTSNPINFCRIDSIGSNFVYGVFYGIGSNNGAIGNFLLGGSFRAAY